jgi:hypothetical protein
VAGSHSAAGVFSVTAVQFLDDIHAFDNLAEGREAGFDVVAGGVIAEIDVDLRGSSIGPGVGEGDIACCVVLLERIIGDGDAALLLRDGGVAVDTELHPAAGDDTEKTRVVVILRADQLVETIGAMGRPIAVGFDDEAACGGFEFHAEDCGSLVVAER